MSTKDHARAYLSLADDLFKGIILENDLPVVTVGLPPLDKELLGILANQAETFSTTQPRLGWAISRVAQESASLQGNDLYLHSLSAWYLARACNHWTQPKRVHEAVSIARRGFTELKDEGWLAACDWQENALAWTKPNFAEATQKLKEALSGLEGSGLDEFIPECRLALAYAQILIGEHEDALENIRLSEAAFITRGEMLNQARCWLYQASSLRRQDQFEEAHHKLEGALAAFEQENAVTDQAKVHYQMALGHLLKTEDLPLAIQQFTKATDMFKLVELDLWQAMCINNLGAVHLFTGELTLADQHLKQAGEVFATQGVNGLLADNLNDHGEVNILRGKPQISIEQFKKSVELNKMLGANLSAAVVGTNLGKAYGQYGRYQDALFHLEQAAEQLQAQDSYLRLGTCEKYIALIWSQLGQPGMAHEHLDQAEANYDLAGQKAMISEVKNIRAAAFFQQGEGDHAIQCLQESLTVSMKFGVRPQTALARRLLGEALVQTGAYAKALRHLTQAYTEFSDMDMQMDMAACLVASGNCYVSASKKSQAQKDYLRALELSRGVLPEIEWRAEVGLGDLAKDSGKATLALKHYRQAVISFSQIRQNFWQPGLAGAYLKKPSQIFDSIILFASAENAVEETFFFVERSKSSTLPGQLLSNRLPGQNSTSYELTDIEAEILFLQDQLRSSLDQLHPFQAGSGVQQIRARLADKTQQFEKEKARLERQAKQDHADSESTDRHFDEFVFRTHANKSLQGNWAAIDYYLAGNVLAAILITPDKFEVMNTRLPHRFHMALDACKRARQNAEAPTQGDLEVLGKILIPAHLADYLTPETFLILSPNKELHRVPWAALKPERSSKPLVKLCTPTIAPSLQSLVSLWQRGASMPHSQKNGLAIGLSSFNGKLRELPQVKDELAFLSSKLGSGGLCLAESDASWKNLVKLNQTSVKGERRGLSRFAWMHIASHFFSDAQTGRLSGLALADGDVWLDAMRDLYPLPRLVTLSACNSMTSFVHDGDEHVDLPSTCLVAGAQNVVGSIWPILDDAAAGFTSRFYSNLLTGMRPAQALAESQRELLDQGASIGEWAGFLCIGTT